MMHKVDQLIEGNQKKLSEALDKYSIRIGFDSPFVVESFVEKIDISSDKEYNQSIVFYVGDQTEIIDKLMNHEIDYAVIIYKNQFVDDLECQRRSILLRPSALIMESVNTYIQPLSIESVKADVIWNPQYIDKPKEKISNILSTICD